jgi:uncharacterized protein with HEPN domain
MPSRDWRERLEDICEAAERIVQYTSALTLDAFCSDQIVIDAVIRNLEVIGEAARHIPIDVEVLHPEIPWAAMRGMRNVLVHDYFDVDLSIIWKTAREDIPGLPSLLHSILDGEP